jgi:hypothetical protein
MARFFFDIDDSTSSRADAEGLDFETSGQACRQATAVLPDIARELGPDGVLREISCTVRDDRGRRIFRTTLSQSNRDLSGE